MVPVTIGVPTYNGADLLDESLACLARQTFRDFKVLIFDNASTDGTSEIAKAWAARDPRFHYLLQVKHVSGLANFRDALLAGDSPWFMWRADDDLSADDYVETLFRLATNSPGCKLAVATTLSHDLDGGRHKLTQPSEKLGSASLKDRLWMLLESHPAWFYGLWDRERITDIYVAVCVNFPFAFAADHAMLYGPIIEGAVRTTSATFFEQRFRRTAATAHPPQRTDMALSLMVETRRAFRYELRRIRSGTRLPAAFRAALVAWEPLYLRHTLPSLLKMVRTGVRERLGLTKTSMTGRHFERNV